jgi:hypothetical protein
LPRPLIAILGLVQPHSCDLDTATSGDGSKPCSTSQRRDRRHGHRLDLDVGAPLIRVDLQEHVLDAQGRALAMGDDQLGFPTAAIIAG